MSVAIVRSTEISTLGPCGVIYVLIEDQRNFIHNNIAETISVYTPIWSVVGFYCLTDTKNNIALFDYWTGKIYSGPLHFLSLADCLSHPLVIRVKIKPIKCKINDAIILDKLFSAELLRDVATNPASAAVGTVVSSVSKLGEPRIAEILTESKYQLPTQEYSVILPPCSRETFLQSRNKLPATPFSVSISNHMIYQLLSCEQLLLDLVTQDSAALRKLVAIMNNYRRSFDVPPLPSFVVASDIDNKITKSNPISGVNVNELTIQQLKELIHVINSHNNAATDEIENFLMNKLAQRSSK
jgi:hypothetical protein